MYAYNPRKKTARELEETLVGDDRREILNNILRELSLEDGETPKQHWIVVGPRGIGKSHLFTLLYYKIREEEKLNDLWIPILFPEELRMVGGLAKFLERAIGEISKEVSDNSKVYDELTGMIEKIRSIPQTERIDYIFSVITWIHKETGKFILFIAENLQHLLGKKIKTIEQKKLRAYLQTGNAILFIGSATTIFNAIHDHSHPFYHFFHIRRMEELDFESVKKLIINILSGEGRGELIARISDNEVRLKAVYSFTGGNPRMAVFMADVLKTDIPDEMLELMDRILDELTPYFDAILKDVPDYLEDILNTLAANEPAQSPKDISAYLEIPQNSVRGYLKQLKESGYVRVAFSMGKSNYYCLNEYLYRIWYQMRDGGHREETRWLMELLLMLYSPHFIVQERARLGNDRNHLYKRLIEQTIDFINTNPEYCRSLELCVKSELKGYGENGELEREKFEEIDKYIENKELDKAIGLCKEILEINPDSIEAYIRWGKCLGKLERNDEADKKYLKALKLLMNESIEKNYYKGALVSTLIYLNILSNDSFVITLQKEYEERILPILNNVNPDDYIKEFYLQEREMTVYKSAIVLMIVSFDKYDVLIDNIKNISVEYFRNDQVSLGVFIFTIKMKIWLHLIYGAPYEALRPLKLYIEYIKSIEKLEEKEEKVSTLCLSLFKVYILMDIELDGISNILNILKEEEGVPFSDAFSKIWTCIYDPESIDGRRYMGDKAIANVVNELKKEQVESVESLSLRHSQI